MRTDADIRRDVEAELLRWTPDVDETPKLQSASPAAASNAYCPQRVACGSVTVDTLVDKTGTLTVGRPTVSDQNGFCFNSPIESCNATRWS